MRHRIAITLSLVLIAIVSGATALQAGWTPDGAPVCTEAMNQYSPEILPDGAGGAFIIWSDYRELAEVYAQRVDEMGRRQWAEGGVELCPANANQGRSCVVPDGTGGFIAVWVGSEDHIDLDIFAQRVDAAGNILWGTSGAVVSIAGGDQAYPAVCSDGAGGCIVTWHDRRDSNNDDIYTQRLDASGNAQWTAGGVVVCTADSIQTDVGIVADGSGGAIIVWLDFRSNGDLYAQKIDAAGAVQWAADGVPVCAVYPQVQWYPASTSDGAGGAFVAWADNRGGDLGVYVQRIDSSGNLLFTPSGLLVCDADDTQRAPLIIADGSGGAIIAWEDFRSGSGFPDLYARLVNGVGWFLWTGTEGEPVRVFATGAVSYTDIVSDGAGGTIITWSDSRDEATSGLDIYAQRVDHSGTAMWTLNGNLICGASEDQDMKAITSDGAGGAIAAWSDKRNADRDIYAMRILADGGYVATTVSSFGAFPVEGSDRLEWTVSERCCVSDFIVSRQELPAGRLLDLDGGPASTDGLEFSFADGSVEPGHEYSYTIFTVEDGDRRALAETGAVEIPVSPLRLYQNSPNPFNPSTKIAWYLDTRAHVTLEIFDAAGRRVATLVDRVQDAGDHEVIWNGTGLDGRNVASGIYLYRLTAGKRTRTRKMVLLR